MEIVKDIETLRQVSEPIDTDKIEFWKPILKHLIEETESRPNCMGLAGIQLGFPYRISYIHVENHEPIVLINPKIVGVSDRVVLYAQEGCMSFPHTFFDTKRYEWVLVEDEHNGVRKYTDVEAICVQHEIEHMDGILIFDHINDSKNLLGKKVGRNDPCICKSGKKYKKCCLN